MRRALSLRMALAPLMMCALSSPSSLYAYSDGPAAVGTVNGTGSPRSGGSCAQCHGSETAATRVSVRVFDARNVEVNRVTGGTSYSVELRVAHDDFSLFGGQLSAFDGMGNISTGFFFGNGENPETQVTAVFGEQFMENNGRSASGIFRARWTAPVDQREVVFYFAGVAVNGSGRGGDRPSSPSSRGFEVDVPCIDEDGDLLCDNIEDDDDDNDGVVDSLDRDPGDPKVCADADGDGCDDCSVGSDGLGPMSDQLVNNDGDDIDGDGVCDRTDSCVGDNMTGDVDGDGVCGDRDQCVGDDALGDADGDGVCGERSFEGRDMDVADMSDAGDALPVDMTTSEEMSAGADMGGEMDQGGVTREPVMLPPRDDEGCSVASGRSPARSPVSMIVLTSLCLVAGLRRRRRAH